MGEITEIIKEVSDVGFPIVFCIVFFKLQGKLNDTLKDLAVTLSAMNVRLDNMENVLIKLGLKHEDSV